MEKEEMICLFDLDNTIADMDHRMKIAGDVPPKENHAEFQMWLDTLQKPEHIEKDTPIYELLALAHLLANKSPAHIVYLTGRWESLREVTQKWLKQHEFPGGPLYMRPVGDHRPPAKFKGDIIEDLVRLYGAGGIAFDDDHAGDTSEVYRKNGFLHLKVLR